MLTRGHWAMRILITNDDGINAPGLAALQSIAEDLTGDPELVTIVAPAFEQSGVGHCISYAHPTMLAELGPRRFALEGSPADCVLAGLHVVMKDTPPDLILSGINWGNNSAENAMYSGTLGGAMEGALQGLPAIGLSQFFGAGNRSLVDPFESARTFGADVIRKILSQDPGAQDGYRLFYNVNFPPVSAAETRGLRAGPQGKRPNTRFSAELQTSPTGRQFLWARGGNQQVSTAPGSDAALNLDGYVSVTPMRADLTAYDALQRLEDGLE